jgi:hypothetical protein
LVMSAYLLGGRERGVRRLGVVFAVCLAVALAGFAAAFVFAHGAAESQPHILPPVPSASERPR